MFRVRKPGRQTVEQLRRHHCSLPLTYAEVGCSAGPAPRGYVADHYRTLVGRGLDMFERSKQALRDWRMLRLGWVQPCWPDAPLCQGTLVAIQARVFGLWSVNLCRIIAVIDEQGPVCRYGFAYGTLPGHVKCGEERFLVEWDRASDAVWYEIRAVSKPGGWLTRLTYPLTRVLQRRFGRASLQAMRDACREGTCDPGRHEPARAATLRVPAPQ